MTSRREYFDAQQRYRRARQFAHAGVTPASPKTDDPEPDPVPDAAGTAVWSVPTAPEPPVRPAARPGFRLRSAAPDPAFPEALPENTLFELRIGPMRIGRAPGSAIRLRDMFVSGDHADLLVGSDRLTVTDLGSTNGTYVNGDRIDEPTALSGGDRLGVGHDVFVVEQVETP